MININTLKVDGNSLYKYLNFNGTVIIISNLRNRRLIEANIRSYFIVLQTKSEKYTLRLSPNVQIYAAELQCRNRITNFLKDLFFFSERKYEQCNILFYQEKVFSYSSKIQPNLYIACKDWLDSEVQRNKFYPSSLTRFRVALNETIFSKKLLAKSM